MTRLQIGIALSCLGLLALPAQAEDKGTITITLVDAKDEQAKRFSKGISLASSEKRRPQKAERSAEQVLFSVQNMSLADVMLKFEEQVGVRIRYHGSLAKKVSLRLVRPVHWEDALELVCQFTDTHLSSDHQGRLELKPRWGGSNSKILKLKAEKESELAKKRRVGNKYDWTSVKASARKRFHRKGGRVFRFVQRPMQFGPQRPNRPRLGPRTRPNRIGQGPRQRTGPRRVGPRRTGPNRRGRGARQAPTSNSF